MTRTAVIAVAIATALLLGGCSSPYVERSGTGGQSNADAGELIESIDGVTSASVVADPWYSPGEGGLFSAEGMDIVVTVAIDAEHRIADPEAFLEFILATAWSAQDAVPKGAVRFDVIGGVRPSFDWISLARTLGYDPPGYDLDEVAIFDDDLEHRFGAWPSSPVAAPAGLLENRPLTTDDLLPDAIGPVTLFSYIAGDTCISVLFERNEDSEGEFYPGDISVELLRDGESLDTDVVRGDDKAAGFCMPEDEWPRGALYQARVTANASEGFRSVVKVSPIERALQR